MWKRMKNAGQSNTRPRFSIVHQYIQRFNDVSGSKSAAVKRRSKTPGVMITQYEVNLPEGKTTPDFQCKPAPVTIKEGQIAVFKAVVTGDPKPDVSWRRTKGIISDKEKFQRKYDDSTGEHTLEIHRVTPAETDTYKCYAVNEYGKAVFTTTLNVIDALTNPADFRKLLKKSKAEKADGENDVKFWDTMLKADRRDYERICSEYDVADFRLVLKKLEEKKKERRQNMPMDGVIPYDDDATEKHGIKSVGRTKDSITVDDLQQNDAGLCHGDVEGVNLRNRQLNGTPAEEDLLFTEFKLSNVDFVMKIQEIAVQERDNALFECVLTHPLPKITWMRKGAVLEDGEKYCITMSDHKLIHRLLIKDCSKQDRAIYSAVAGITSCSAWLVVEGESNSVSGGKKTLCKTTLTDGPKTDLEKVAKEQQIKSQKEMESILAAVKAKHAAGQLRQEKRIATGGEDQSGTDKTANTKSKNSKGDGKVLKLDHFRCVTEAGEQLRAADPKKQTQARVHFDKETDANEGEPFEENEDFTGLGINSKYIKQGHKLEHVVTESGDQDVDRDQHGMLTICQHEMTESSANFREPIGDQKKTKKDQWNDHDPGSNTDLNEQASENKPSDVDADEESAGQRKNGGSSKQNKKPKDDAANEFRGERVDVDAQQMLPMRQFEMAEPSANENLKAAGKNEMKKKKVQRKEHVSESSDELVDADQHQMLPVSQHKMAEPSGNGNFKSTVRNDGTSKTVQWKEHASGSNTDPKEQASNNEPSDADKDDESSGQRKHRGSSKQSKKPKGDGEANDESMFPEDYCKCDETADVNDSSTHTRRKRQSPLTEDLSTHAAVQFIWGLSDVDAIINETAELTCKLSSEDCEGAWFRDGKKISPDDPFTITKDGPIHKLVIIKCNEHHSGKYRFEADGRKTAAMINVKDPPRFDTEDLNAFTQPLTVRVGHNAIFKLPFVGHTPIKIQWYREGEELQVDNITKIEKSAGHSCLLLSRCQRKDTGEIRIKLKNEHGFIEAVSQLIVLDKPTSPQGPAEVTESSAACIQFKWRPPKDDGGSPVINYTLERQQVGRNTWKKIGEMPRVPSFRDTDVDRGRKYCYRIRAVTSEGTSEVMETDEMQAGRYVLPGPPTPPKVVSAFSDCINLSWASPSKTGGSRILGYVLEKRKKGSNLWTVVNADEPIKEKKYAVRDVVESVEYEFRVSAINLSGAGEYSNASEFVLARDPKKPPGKVIGLKVTETSYTNMVLTWIKPEVIPDIQDEAKGYFVEIRWADCIGWSRCNSTPIYTTAFNAKGLKSMDMYWVRVIATNDGGESAPEELPNYVLAMPLPVRPKFTNNKMKSFMVVRAGNSVRITVNFEASPRTEIMWFKDKVPIAKRVTISNSDESSQLLIPSSEHSDSGIYSILVKNLAGQETFSTEVRVTDDPKPPGPVELEENVPGTVTVIWVPSPDEKRDDRLYYSVSKLDSTRHTWTTVADKLFNNRFTVCNTMHGREYHFRVYAKNDIGISEPSESPRWGMEKKKEKIVASEPTSKHCDLQCAPSFIVPLKLHTATKGYECHMSCAVKGNPTPRITWYRNCLSLNTDTNYYISNTFGVCSMRILCVGPKDVGEYTVIAENSLGRAECSTVLSVRE
ncbi:immunoglobulin-like and fibronectin type III domain-containing protein 1 isoform 2-T2 [Odontesthes bonariensis]